MGIYISYTRHEAGPTKLKCYDDGPHACDVEAVEGLGVWDLVLPQIFRRWHLEPFQLLEMRAARGSHLYPIKEGRESHSAVDPDLSIQWHTAL